MKPGVFSNQCVVEVRHRVYWDRGRLARQSAVRRAHLLRIPLVPYYLALRARGGRAARGPREELELLLFSQICLCGRADFFAHQLKRKPQTQEMIEQALGVSTVLRPASNAKTFLYRVVDQILF